MEDLSRTTAERLTLTSDIHHLRPDPPVFVQAGESYWFDRERRLYVEGSDGSVRSYSAARPGGPDAVR